MVINLRILLIMGIIFCLIPVFGLSKSLNNNVTKYDQITPLLPDNSVLYYSYKGNFKPLNQFIDYEVVDINLNNKNLQILPVLASNLDTVQNVAVGNNALAAINAGFFDVSNGSSVSYVVINKNMVGDPRENLNLTSNLNIKPYLKSIYNRAELKVLNCSGKIKYEINYHGHQKSNCELLNSLQGGPQLLPKLDLEKEGFLAFKNGKKIREAANVTNPDARVAVGLTSNNHMIWVVTKAGYNNSEYYGLTVKQLVVLLKYLSVTSALAFDGGSSTTMYLRLPDGKIRVIIGDINKTGERIPAKVKSVLILKEG